MSVQKGSMMTDQSNNNLIAYGVWIKGKGWLRGKGVFADTSIEKAYQVARLLGGTVRYIDASLIDLESEFLEKERQSLWHTLTSYFKRKNSS